LGLTNLKEMGANSLIGGKFFLYDNKKKYWWHFFQIGGQWGHMC
jgi:hypothetical protein